MQSSQSLDSHPSRRKIAKTFGLKAASYEQFAHFQAETINHLIAKYGDRIQKDQIWVDLGCGTGLFSKSLQEHKKKASFIGLDISPESLKISSQSTRYTVLADIESLPLKKGSVDGFILASVIQWLADARKVMSDLHKCLTKKGVVLFSVFIDESFHELNIVKRSLGLTVPVSLPPVESFITTLKQCEFSIPNFDVLEHTYFFPTAMDALKSMSGYGATAASDKLMTKNQIKKLCTDYENKFKCDNGIPVTYKAIIGIAEKE